LRNAPSSILENAYFSTIPEDPDEDTTPACVVNDRAYFGHAGDAVPVVYALKDMWTDAAVPGGVGHGLAHITIAGAKHHGMRHLEVHPPSANQHF
jgi:hypothetical protein